VKWAKNYGGKKILSKNNLPEGKNGAEFGGGRGRADKMTINMGTKNILGHLRIVKRKIKYCGEGGEAGNEV